MKEGSLLSVKLHSMDFLKADLVGCMQSHIQGYMYNILAKLDYQERVLTYGGCLQSRIQGYMYNILSETDYQERILPATPPRAKTPPSPGPTAERQQALPLIDARPSSSRGDERMRASSRFSDRAPAFRRGSRDLVRSCWLARTSCLPLILHALPVFAPLQFEADSPKSRSCWGHVCD